MATLKLSARHQLSHLIHALMHESNTVECPLAMHNVVVILEAGNSVPALRWNALAD